MTFAEQKVLILIKSNLPFYFMDHTFDIIPKNSSQNSNLHNFSSTFSSKNFVILHFTFGLLPTLSGVCVCVCVCVCVRYEISI